LSSNTNLKLTQINQLLLRETNLSAFAVRLKNFGIRYKLSVPNRRQWLQGNLLSYLWRTIAKYAKSCGQFFLKFIISHPAVNCVIPGTSDMDHLDDNLDAGIGPMPDAAMRARMASYIDGL